MNTSMDLYDDRRGLYVCCPYLRWGRRFCKSEPQVAIITQNPWTSSAFHTRAAALTYAVKDEFALNYQTMSTHLSGVSPGAEVPPSHFRNANTTQFPAEFDLSLSTISLYIADSWDWIQTRYWIRVYNCHGSTIGALKIFGCFMF